MKTLLKSKGVLAIIAIFIAAVFSYNSFFSSDTVPASSQASIPVGDDLLKIFEELQRVTLDRSVLSSPGFLLLADFTTSIPQQTTGRPNPFDLIGRD